ncbi:uncharacterized protein MICPUCDRAFT_38841 [Micromonas pusilla CCMP1545]|uniref:Predicted protein n=1 Tax=Micromonas pusilla (strain CCMP1545) TaxID=564608 RepID=C1MM87_MICPC|nr:uncharacterized protein MICPUCDRAFT_38841 [Micromonas pusilla CCMP1545]EEH59001.1 predicted protein [Micromonas pusilla CCMP1545]|eukprot:XP_003057356.1 predicted protein [Micromonas pusilla CCMP1545]
MAELAGPKIGDARSLWNFTPSPGWKLEEVAKLRLCLMKFGIGRWVQIVDSGILPGKQIQQLNGQTQRLLGQQSLAEYTGMHLDVDRVRADNNAKQGPEIYRKNSLITNTGGKLSKEARDVLRAANQEKYGLMREQIDAVVLPEAPKGKGPLGADAYMGKNHNKGGIAGVKRDRCEDVMTVDVDSLPASAKLALLVALRKRLVTLQGLADGDERVLKETQRFPEKAKIATKAAKGKKAGAAGGGGGGGGAGIQNDAPTAKSAEKPAAAKKARRDSGAAAAAKSADADAIAQLVAMGFDGKKAKAAIKESGGDVMGAVNWLCANCA